MCAASIACKAGSLASHCDPDSNCSPEIEGGREGRRYRERVEIERDKENGSETGQRRGRRSWELRDRERESYFLWVFERERRARSVCVRSVVQLINLWQEGFRCSVPWIAALIYMVIFFKTLAAYKKPFISISAKPKPFLYSLNTYTQMRRAHVGQTLHQMWLYEEYARTSLNFTLLIRLSCAGRAFGLD